VLDIETTGDGIENEIAIGEDRVTITALGGDHNRDGARVFLRDFPFLALRPLYGHVHRFLIPAVCSYRMIQVLRSLLLMMTPRLPTTGDCCSLKIQVGLCILAAISALFDLRDSIAQASVAVAARFPKRPNESVGRRISIPASEQFVSAFTKRILRTGIT
jgi:hypothetical protein